MTIAVQPLSCADSAQLPTTCALCQVRSQSICAELDDRELGQLQTAMSHLAVTRNTALVCEDEPVEHLFVLTQGLLRLSKLLEDGRQQIIGFAFPGDFIGLTATQQASFTAEALGDGHVCRFSHSALERMAQDHPGIKDRLIEKAQTELSKAYDHMTLLGQKTVTERLASFFCTVAERAGVPVAGQADAVQMQLGMSRRDIADYLAIRLETLSRTLRQFKDEGVIIEAQRGSVRIPDINRLKAMRVLAEQ